MLSALLTATIQVLEATKELKSNQESLKSEIDDLKQQVSESSNPEVIRTLISEELSNIDVSQAFTTTDTKLDNMQETMQDVKNSMDVVGNAMTIILNDSPKKEELIEVIEKGLSASTKDYSEPLSKVAHGFAVTQENVKKLAKHIDEMSENMTELSEATIENSARVKSLDVRLATMVHDTLDSEDSLDKSLETLKKMTK
jgi:hypothetical protein